METVEEDHDNMEDIDTSQFVENQEPEGECTNTLYEPIYREIEIFENERYNFQQLSAMKWSSKGLLPTDRKMLSTKNGKYDWATFDEANHELISRGWNWNGDWVVDTTFPGTDAEGWGYASSFGSIDASTSPVKEMMHFVRRRRMTRQQVFYLYSAMDETCRYCDSLKIEMLSSSMFEAITRASLHENPPSSSTDKASDISPTVTNQLLSALVDIVDVGEASSATPQHTLLEIEGSISSFLATIVSRKGLWGKTKSMTRSMMSSAADVDFETLRHRQLELQTSFVDLRQFKYMAVMCIRKYDKDHHYHCNIRSCGSDCPFAPYECVNDRCQVVTSQIHRVDHDNECPWKIVECPKNCGDHIPRREVETHLLMACGMREESCPFATVGCLCQDIAHKDLPAHLDSCMESHLLLTLTRLVEQQNVIKQLHKDMRHLGGRVDAHDKSISTLDAGAIAATRTLSRMRQETNEMQSKTSKDIEKRVDRDLKSVANDVNKMNKTVSVLKKRTDEVAMAAAAAPPPATQPTTRNSSTGTK